MGPEAKLYKKVKEWIEKRIKAGEPIWKLKVHGGPGQSSGVPDLLLCVNGLFLAVELKAGSPVSLLQQKQISDIRDAGGRAEVCTSLDAVDKLINETLRKSMGYVCD